MRRPLRSLFVLGALALALVPANVATAGAQTETKVVKIGVIAPLEAGLVDFGEGIRNSVQVAIDQANQKNAIPGWKIELAAADDSSNPDIGKSNAPQLVDDPEVVGVVGTYNSGVAAAILPLLAPAHLALISPGNTLASLTLGDDPANASRPYDNYFRLVASDARQAPFLAKSARKLGIKKVAVVSETKAVSKGLADAFVEAFTKDGGKITTREVVPDGTSDFHDFLDTALPKKPEMIFFGGEYKVAATLRAQATEDGYRKPLMGGDGIKDATFITDAGTPSKGTLASTVGVPADKLKTAKPFLTLYRNSAFNAKETDFGPYAYDAANLIISAAKKILAGQDTIPSDAREQVVAAVQAARTKGATGKIGFDRYGDTTNVVFTLFRVRGKPLAWVPFRP